MSRADSKSGVAAGLAGESTECSDGSTSPTSAGGVMVELRAEDVKEALEAWDIGVLTLPDEDEWTVPPEQEAIVAAARLWLASQEQTPDERRCEHGLIGAHHIAHYGCDGNGCGQQCPGGAALVGFHPQPKGDER